MIKCLNVLLIKLLIITLAWAQAPKVFTQEQLLWYVKNYHPISVQGNLLLKKGESTVRKAKGEFDPLLYGNLDQKNYDDKTYYSILESGLKVPTWYGIELKTGFDQNRGLFLNPENSHPAGGLWNAGISVSLGQGLFINDRMATLKQAKLFAESTYAEQRQLMNDLYFNAIKQYWTWVEAWNQYMINQESVELALTRFNAVKQSFMFGDIPAIDTLEAYIQLQNRQLNARQSDLNYRNVTLKLSNFLWFEKNTPLEITDSLRPPYFKETELKNTVSSQTLQSFLLELEEVHPEMQLYGFKLASMDIERRLKIEGLKPKVDLNYNILNEPIGGNIFSELSPQNYKWGVELSFPLFLRKQRGDLQLTKLKIQDVKLNQTMKLLEIQNKVRSYYNEQINLEEQIDLSTEVISNYNRLLLGERRKFESGESSLFLVNSRETNLIQARLKLINLLTKYNIAQNGFVWASGRLVEQKR